MVDLSIAMLNYQRVGPSSIGCLLPSEVSWTATSGGATPQRRASACGASAERPLRALARPREMPRRWSWPAPRWRCDGHLENLWEKHQKKWNSRTSWWILVAHFSASLLKVATVGFLRFEWIWELFIYVHLTYCMEYMASFFGFWLDFQWDEWLWKSERNHSQISSISSLLFPL